MAIRVYFGPFKHSPVDEAPLDERLLWLDDFHQLLGLDRDFWTSNPMVLDVFERSQVMVWLENQSIWMDLESAILMRLGAAADAPVLGSIKNGHLALLILSGVELMARAVPTRTGG